MIAKVLPAKTGHMCDPRPQKMESGSGSITLVADTLHDLVYDRDRLAEIDHRQVTETINFGIKNETEQTW